MRRKSLVIFLHQNIWDISSIEALEVEKYQKKSDVVAYELGYFINKNLVPAFKKKLNKNYIEKKTNFLDWKKHFLKTLTKYDLRKVLIINKVKPTNYWGFLVLYELSKIKVNIVEYQNSGVPQFSTKKRFNEKLKILTDLKYIFSLITGRVFLLFSKFLKFYNYFYLISGEPNKKINKDKIIYGSSWDMAKTFNKNKKLKIESKFAVYIESTIAHVGDHKILGPNVAKINKKKWFKELNLFFDFIEKEYNLKIFVASHPKVNHKHLKDLYKKRKIFYGNTKELIYKSQLVLFERSSAINFIIKYFKPAIMIYNGDTISTSYNKKIHRGFAKLTDIKNINIENFSKIDLKSIFKVNRYKYLKFYKQFINFKNIKVANYKIIQKKFLGL